MTKGKPRILVADDERRYVRAIQVNLEASGYEVQMAYDGKTAVEMAATQEPDLILLDVLMPELTGHEACRQIREFSTVPIIMLTALAENANKVQGLDAGADDYVTKPFSAEELLARVRAALRRASYQPLSGAVPVFQVGQLHLDFVKQRVFLGAQELDLTPTEYRLLSELAREAGRVLTPEHLLLKVWGPGYAGQERLIWQAIHRLRHKVETDPHHAQYILTKVGIGYYLVAPADYVSPAPPPAA